MQTIFIGGVHGVGKSQCCKDASKSLGVPHRTASALIRSQDASLIHETEKAIKSVTLNQQQLINAVRDFFARGEQHLLLDGHFTIPTVGGREEKVPVGVFAALELSAIMVFKGDPQSIWERRMKRDGSAPPPSDIENSQNMEWQHAQFVAAQLRVPAIALAMDDKEGLFRAIVRLWPSVTNSRD